MSEFIKSYGTLLLAIYGVVQVWIIALWRKYVRKGIINVYETCSIEIGYSTFGPTIGLNGTIRSLYKDVFISSIELMIVRKRDKSQHMFQWISFRSPKIDFAGTQPVLMEIPSGFLVSPDSPHRYSIVFNDNDLFEEIRPLFNNYVSEWYKVANQLSRIWPPSVGNIPPAELQANQQGLIQDFRKSVLHVDMYTSLDRKCYWEPGDYSLTVNVKASKPDTVFSNAYQFTISESDSKNLKLNVITILEEPIANYLRVRNYPYNFAYAIYKKS